MQSGSVIACVGAGYWGRNLVRVFHELPGVRLKRVCDLSEKIRQAISSQYRDVEVAADLFAKEMRLCAGSGLR